MCLKFKLSNYRRSAQGPDVVEVNINYFPFHSLTLIDLRYLLVIDMAFVQVSVLSVKRSTCCISLSGKLVSYWGSKTLCAFFCYWSNWIFVSLRTRPIHIYYFLLINVVFGVVLLWTLKMFKGMYLCDRSIYNGLVLFAGTQNVLVIRDVRCVLKCTYTFW